VDLPEYPALMDRKHAHIQPGNQHLQIFYIQAVLLNVPHQGCIEYSLPEYQRRHGKRRMFYPTRDEKNIIVARNIKMLVSI
jgi:hypothetical protein